MHDKSIAQTQSLRFVINLGNPLLAKEVDGALSGLSIDLAHRFCQQRGESCVMTTVDNAREAVAILEAQKADIGFLAIDPLRAEHLLFTRPYLLIKGCYVVREDSSIQSIEQVDQPGHEVVVGLGSAYDLYLSRHLQNAGIQRARSSAEVTPMFLKENAHVAAGVKYQLEMDIQKHQGLRLLTGHFMLIQQAMATHRQSQNDLSLDLQLFLDDCIDSGFLAQAMKKHQISGAEIADFTH